MKKNRNHYFPLHADPKKKPKLSFMQHIQKQMPLFRCHIFQKHWDIMQEKLLQKNVSDNENLLYTTQTGYKTIQSSNVTPLKMSILAQLKLEFL